MQRPTHVSTQALLEELLSQRILVLDGSMGALLFAPRPEGGGLPGQPLPQSPGPLKNCTDVLVLTQPELIEQIHHDYLDAGADIIETDTFNATRCRWTSSSWRSMSPRSTAPLRSWPAAPPTTGTPAHPDKPRFVAGSIGPTKKTLSIGTHASAPGQRDVTFDQIVANYYEQIEALVAGGVDILLPETCIDILVLKACLFALDKFFPDTGRLPVIVSGTIFTTAGPSRARRSRRFTSR